MRGSSQPEPPVIVVLGAGAEAIRREVLAGIEEEGVPYRVDPPQPPDTDTSARDLAMRAAQRSPLQVGVGIGAGGDACVHHAQLAEYLSELAIVGGDLGAARALGHNAARIVVGLPLKPTIGRTDRDGGRT